MNLKPLVAVIALAVVSPSFGSTLFETGFESPTYALTDIDGQDGWSYFTSDATNPTNTASVTNNRAFAGTNSLLVTAADDEYSDAIRPVAYTPSTAAEKILRIDSMVFVEPSGTDETDEGIVGIDVYDDAENVCASLAIGTATGIVYVYDFDSDDYLFDPTAPTLSLGAWHRLSIVLDFSGPSPVYTIGTDGNFVNVTAEGLTTGFTATSILGDVDPVAFGGLGVDAAGYFDDLSVQAVPEPAALLPLGLGALALLRRRSR